MRDDTSVFVGGDNVFADLRLSNATGLLAKAKLTAQIQNLLEQQGLTDAQTAAHMDIGAEKLSHLLAGGFDDFTFDQIFQFLNRLGLDVEVYTRVQSQNPQDAALTVIAA